MGEDGSSELAPVSEAAGGVPDPPRPRVHALGAPVGDRWAAALTMPRSWRLIMRVTRRMGSAWSGPPNCTTGAGCCGTSAWSWTPGGLLDRLGTGRLDGDLAQRIESLAALEAALLGAREPEEPGAGESVV